MDFEDLKQRTARCPLPPSSGSVIAANEIAIDAVLPGARVGMLVEISGREGREVTAEIAACTGTEVKLLPLAHTHGIGPGDRVRSLSAQHVIPCGMALLGRVIDPLGAPLDSGEVLADLEPWPVHRAAPDPLSRQPIAEQLVTGIRVIDACLSLGLGQRIGLFAGAGLGKSTLLGALARRANVDVSVICLVGERGREVRDFLDRILSKEGLARSVIVLATADTPPLVRAKALLAATAIAEWFRAKGMNVLLLVDSLTRVLRARRDVGLALGEAPARRGFPASAFASLPELLERTGRDDKGSITALYAVLTEGEGDPVAEEARSLLDGHIALSPKLARLNHWPAIDILHSVSRVMDAVVGEDNAAAVRNLKKLVAAYEEQENLILMGAYRRGTSQETDLAIERKNEIASFLKQGGNEFTPLVETRKKLAHLVRGMA